MDSLERRTFLAVGGGTLAGLAGCTGPQSMYEGTERVTVDAGDHALYEFDLTSPVTMQYAVDVIEGGPIDVIVTKRAHYRAISDGELGRYSGGASILDVATADVEANLMQGKWVLLLDNSNLVREDDATNERAVVEFEYELTQYIPYGSGQE